MNNDQTIRRTKILKRSAEIVEQMNPIDTQDRLICSFIAIRNAVLEETGIDIRPMEHADRVKVMDEVGLTGPVFRNFCRVIAYGETTAKGATIN